MVGRANMRTVKRYKNRKLYDTENSRYITLAGLGKLIHNGEDIRVIDAKTQEDITGMVLTQILLQEQRHQDMPVALTRIRELLRSGEELLHTSVQKISSEAEKTVQKPLSDIRQFMESRMSAFDDFQNLVNERMESILVTMRQTHVQEDCKAIQDKIESMEKRIEKLEKITRKSTTGEKK